jgi:glyoxylase-like metal-dependent hydrolase (beta-lactamase superfamily II)
MLFSLEALRAKHGDCLILHFGDSKQPRLIVIDGGPLGVYKDVFRPRLDALAEQLGNGKELAIEVLMVSHIDDDHIRGVLDLSSRLLEEKADKGLPFDVHTMWLNAFDDLLGNDAEELAAGVAEAPARVAEAGAGDTSWAGESQAVLASVSQGRELRDNARGLGWKPNDGFASFVIAPESGGHKITLGDLQLTVVCPMLPQLEALQKEWRKKLSAMKAAAKPAEVAALAASIDSSVYNLSSIVCLAELGGKRILLTGDALGANILTGLRAAGLLHADGRIEVDVLKLPHHGSDRNVDAAFFETIQARHYVVSGDGKYHNPEPHTFKLISESRTDNEFELHLTYEDCKEGVGEELAAFFAAERKAGRSYGVKFRAEAEQSLKVDLLEPVTY